jgi:hypothetical protein
MTHWINLQALCKIVIGGLVAGAGLPALFAVGLRALGTTRAGQPLGADSDRVVGDNPVGIAVAVVCFAVVLAAVGWGIYLSVAG